MNGYHNQRRPDNQGNRGQGRDQDYQREDFSFDKPFFTPEGELNPDWVKSEAEKLSEKISKGRDSIATSSLRNFYNEFIRIKNLPKHSDEEKKILIRLLVAKVNYKKMAASGKFPNDFVNFIRKLVDAINDDIDRFEKACYIMEAIVGYYPKNN